MTNQTIARILNLLDQAARSREELCLSRMATDQAWEQFAIIDDGLDSVGESLRQVTGLDNSQLYYVRDSFQ